MIGGWVVLVVGVRPWLCWVDWVGGGPRELHVHRIGGVGWFAL
jgi:hypothetical protein